MLAMDGFSPAAMALVMPKRLVAEFGTGAAADGGVVAAVPGVCGSRWTQATALAIRADERGSGGERAAERDERSRGLGRGLLAADGVPVRMAQAGDADSLTGAIVKYAAGEAAGRGSAGAGASVLLAA